MKDCNSTESSMKTTQNKELRIRYKGHPLHLATINLKQIQNTNSVTKNLEQSQHTAMPEAVYFEGRLIKDIEPKLGPSCIDSQKNLARRQSENRPWKRKNGRDP